MQLGNDCVYFETGDIISLVTKLILSELGCIIYHYHYPAVWQDSSANPESCF